MNALSAVLLALLASGGALQADRRPSGLRPLDFERARTVARVERRPVLAVFCAGPAELQQLAEGVAKDAQLRKWLAERLVAVALDRAAEPELAARYRVRRTPTYLFVDERGVELDRLVGARDGQALRGEGEEILKGGDALQRVDRLRVGREADPDLRLRRADVLADRGDLDAALSEYLAIHGSGGAAGVEAFDEVLRLARFHPRAADAVGAIVAALEPRIVAGRADEAEFARWLDLCTRLRFDTRLLHAYDALAPRVEAAEPGHDEHDAEVDPDDPPTSAEDAAARAARARELRARLAPLLRDVFYADRRYADLAPLLTAPLGDFAARRAAHGRVSAQGDPAETRRSLARLRQDTARDFEALVGVRQLSDALLLADGLVAFDPTAATYDALVDAALRAGSRAEAELVARRGREDARVDPRERARIGASIPEEKGQE
ncbi:MAG: thioredoxin family protein [Planctomycetes bacterium]|nr:thioredoxin family protein [Planctomycetota bacterium]